MVHPNQALSQLPADDLTASIRNSLSALTVTMTPGAAPQATGASWAASHQLPHPKGFGKPMEDWSVHDVQVGWGAGRSVAKLGVFLKFRDQLLACCLSPFLQCHTVELQ